MTFLYLKIIHVLSSMLFFGTGLGSVFYKMRADRSGDPQVIAFCQRNVVLADWLFTVPSAVILPVTGVWMALDRGIPLTRSWVLTGLIGYTVAGITWLPAAFLQVKMRNLANESAASGQPMSPQFARYNKIWLILGFPSFTAAMIVIYAMVFRDVAF